MTADDPAGSAGESRSPPTAPDTISLSMRNFDTEERARDLGNTVAHAVREISRVIDFADLDGITIAYDYSQALADLERGVSTSTQLTASDHWAVGIAMAPLVLRDGKPKTHIIMHAGIAEQLHSDAEADVALALHTLAHECAHVEINSRYEAAFPGVVLRKELPDLQEVARMQILMACWDEYAATRISATWGQDPTDGYEETFLHALENARREGNEKIQEYRFTGDTSQLVVDIYRVYGSLLKFASYHLGNLEGREINWRDRPATAEALKGHWFEPYFVRLKACCEAVAEDYGKWADHAALDAIADLADDLISTEGGVILSRMEGGMLYADVPFSEERPCPPLFPAPGVEGGGGN